MSRTFVFHYNSAEKLLTKQQKKNSRFFRNYINIFNFFHGWKKKYIFKINETLRILDIFFKGLDGFQRIKTGTFLLFFFYISNEIFYSHSLPYKRYIFDKYFVKFLLKNFVSSDIGTSSPVTLQKKVLSTQSG